MRTITVTYPDGKAFPIIEWSGLPFMKQILRANDWHGEIDSDKIQQIYLIFSEDYVNG